MIYYIIKHKSTGEFMPQAKKDRGYSHWNPSNPNHIFNQKMNIPRLIENEKRAKHIISMWVANPNGNHTSYQDSYTGEWDDSVDFKPDGRKKEDLEIIRISLRELNKL